jgi:GLPGLI family protein
MKVYFSLVFLLFFSLAHTQEKTIKVIYTKAVKKITDESDKPPQLISDLNYILLTNKHQSLFYFDKKLDNDYESNSRLINRAGGGSVHFVSYRDSIKLEQTKFADQLFLIERPLNEYVWEITNEFKIINNYKSYKAICEYEIYSELRKKTIKFKIIAWFTTEIPLSFGPAGFNGLPGLILELQNGGFYYIATNISNTNAIIISPTKGKNVTQKEYDEFVVKVTRDRFDIKN